jgi:hypothetical protein
MRAFLAIAHHSRQFYSRQIYQVFTFRQLTVNKNLSTDAFDLAAEQLVSERLALYF